MSRAITALFFFALSYRLFEAGTEKQTARIRHQVLNCSYTPQFSEGCEAADTLIYTAK